MRWIVALTVFVVASALLSLGTPRLIASILKAPAHALLTQMEAGRTPPRDQLESALIHLERARSWEHSAQLASEIGLLHLLDAFQTDLADAGRAATARLAAERLRESLTLSPSRPHPWVRLAYAEEFEPGRDAEIAQLLEQSTAVGAFVGEVALVRLRLLLNHWDGLSPDLRRYTFKQIRYVWANDQSFVLQAGKQTSRPNIIRFALRPIPGALDRFDQAVPPFAN